VTNRREIIENRGKLEISEKANYSSTLEEEQIDRYDTTLQRLKAFTNLEFAEKLEKGIEEEFK